MRGGRVVRRPVRGFGGGGGIRAVAPVNTVAPVASGLTPVGSTLSTTNGTWTGTAPISYTYQWQRDGVDIGGATASTYVTVAADAGTSVRPRVTGTNVAGSSTATGNAISVDSSIYSISGWDNTNNRYYSGANDGNPKPSGTTNFSCFALVRITQVPTGAQQIFGHSVISATTDGWSLWSNGATLSFTAFDSVGAKTAPTRNWVAGDVGKIHGVVGTFDGSVLKMYFDNAQVGTSTSCGSMDTPAATLRTSIGAGDNSGTDPFAAPHYEIIGVAYSTTALSLAQVQSWFASVKSSRNIVTPGVGTCNLWSTSDNVGISSPWADSLQGEALTRRGTGLTLNTINTETWGW